MKRAVNKVAKRHPRETAAPLVDFRQQAKNIEHGGVILCIVGETRYCGIVTTPKLIPPFLPSMSSG